MEYKIVGSESWAKLVELVNLYISIDGYEPLGGVCVDKSVFYQAMIRKPKASK